MKNQKNLVISLLLIIIQFGFAWIPNLPISQSVSVYLFYIIAVLASIFAILSLIKKEAVAAIGILLLEIAVVWVVMMGGGLGK